MKGKFMSAIEKIRKVLEKSPYKVGDNIEGRFTIFPDGSAEFVIKRGMKSASYLFTEEGDLLLTVTPRESE
jgi:hypothetical protein